MTLLINEIFSLTVRRLPFWGIMCNYGCVCACHHERGTYLFDYTQILTVVVVIAYTAFLNDYLLNHPTTKHIHQSNKINTFKSEYFIT